MCLCRVQVCLCRVLQACLCRVLFPGPLVSFPEPQVVLFPEPLVECLEPLVECRLARLLGEYHCSYQAMTRLCQQEHLVLRQEPGYLPLQEVYRL